MRLDALTAADIWATVLESAKHSSLSPENLAESLINADEVIRRAIQPVSDAQSTQREEPEGTSPEPGHVPEADRQASSSLHRCIFVLREG